MICHHNILLDYSSLISPYIFILYSIPQISLIKKFIVIYISFLTPIFKIIFHPLNQLTCIYVIWGKLISHLRLYHKQHYSNQNYQTLPSKKSYISSYARYSLDSIPNRNLSSITSRVHPTHRLC